MSIQLPQIDLQGLLPMAGLVVIALAAVGGIVLWVALRSKVAMVVAIVIGVIAAGPMLVQAVGSIVSALVPLVLIGVVGTIGMALVLARNPDLTDLVRDFRPQPPASIERPRIVIDQPPSLSLPGGQPTRVVTKRTVDQDTLRDWGW